MELARQNWKRLQVPRFAIHLQLSRYLRLMLGLLFGSMVIVSGVVALTRFVPPSSNPFYAYTDILPGHPKQTALDLGFACFAVMFDDSQSCSRRDEPASPLFSRVHLSTLGDHISTLDFDVYVNTLTIGDLALLWGRPDIQLSGHIAQVRWSSPNVTALAILRSVRPLNYFTSVAYISFTAS